MLLLEILNLLEDDIDISRLVYLHILPVLNGHNLDPRDARPHQVLQGLLYELYNKNK